MVLSFLRFEHLSAGTSHMKAQAIIWFTNTESDNGQVMKDKKFLLNSLGISLLLIVLDQATKFLAVFNLKGKEAFVLIPGVLEFRYLENQSAAFSIDPVSLLQRVFHFAVFEEDPAAFLKAKMAFFILLTVIVSGLIAWFYCKIPRISRFRWLDLALLLVFSGAIGNLIDRSLQSYVVDFIYFSLIDFPIFNVADIYVTCAAFLLVFLFIFYYKEEDLDLIFPDKKDKRQKQE